jgi:hypothetical protein
MREGHRDRRNTRRFQTALPVLITIGEQSWRTHAVDISFGGVRFRTPEPVEPGVRVWVEMQLDSAVRFPAVIVRNQADTCGSRFDELGLDEARSLAHWLAGRPSAAEA